MNRPISTHISQLLNAALQAADPAEAVRQHLQREGKGNAVRLIVGPYEFNPRKGRLFLVSVGKAALTMGRAALDILEDTLAEGIIIGKRNPESVPGPPRIFSGSSSGRQVRIFEAGHPVSDETSREATAAVEAMLAQTRPEDLVLCLISGGTSALLAKPAVPLAQWQAVTNALLESGCTIQEFNRVRRQLDRVKGGGLARMAAPAATAALILSDVVGNDLAAIGSGPTVVTDELPQGARAVLERYKIDQALDSQEWQQVNAALAGITPAGLGDTQVVNLVIGDVRKTATAVVKKARELGFSAHLLTALLEGEAREVGRVIAALAKDAPAGTCLVLGGETTVTVRGQGKGGRNQELALAAAISIAGEEHIAIAAFATDGEDGPTDAAGALVTGRTIPAAQNAGLDPYVYLHNNDSYTFFTELAKQSEQSFLLKPGRTGTNVNDIVVVLKLEET